MFIVQQVSEDGVFEVNTLALPFFVATDVPLMRHVERRLNEAFFGKEVEDPEQQMSLLAIEAIVEAKPVHGLRELLTAILGLDVERRLSEVPDLSRPPPQHQQPARTEAELVPPMEVMT